MKHRRKPHAFRRGRRRRISPTEFESGVSNILQWAKKQQLQTAAGLLQ